MRDDTTRRKLVARLQQDLVGPLDGPDEKITDRPSDRYLTGMLFPPRTRTDQSENNSPDLSNSDPEGSSDNAVPFSSAMRPASAGISFAVRPDGTLPVAVDVFIQAGIYLASSQSEVGPTVWYRTEVQFEGTLPINAIRAGEGFKRFSSDKLKISGMELYVRAADVGDGRVLVTLAVSNVHDVNTKSAETQSDELVFFQVDMVARPAPGTTICEKPASRIDANDDEDVATGNLIYRDVKDHVVGHTCAARFVEDGEGVMTEVGTEWLPSAIVRKPRETGDEIFDQLTHSADEKPLDARWLSEAPREKILVGLEKIALLYEQWISVREEEGKRLDDVELRNQARKHVETAHEVATRIRGGIALLESDCLAFDAFRLANRAIWLQDRWKKERRSSTEPLVWRPFQLAFVLLSLISSSNEDDPYRKTMDLLWFPTGGGKTEAYLLLAAHVIFLRRLRADGDPSGAGVTVFMRYTLRLLTIQQFQRAAALICACELLREGKEVLGAVVLPPHFATDAPISIGLWVGEASVPNKVKDAIEALEQEQKGQQQPSSPRRLTRCPQCDTELKWQSSANTKRVEAHCDAGRCSLAGKPLPIWTVDENIYQVLPSLMIGTADKYAQLARNGKTGMLFGIGTNHAPPSLIIQDELHLISGPLGTISGLYEIAVDELCAHQGGRAKIIGSTATIRRAESQIRALFNRSAAQFPPPGLDHGNSGFAATDIDDPGRLYVGVTTIGRSAKFTLQATIASLMQSATDSSISPEEQDSYWTLVTYFNSLRELGGALVLARDDVGHSIKQYASRRETDIARKVSAPEELTSRVSASQINEILDLLELPFGKEDCVDSVLASNMISVGIDVTRLGVMVVNGQPKSIAEYIQATSRVGRGNVPGIVVSIYNANKSRDRSRFENFQNWHRSLYRDVEATGVTPFAERARERALHAAFVICARYLVPELREVPAGAEKVRADLEAIIGRIVTRAKETEQSAAETEAVEEDLRSFLQGWIDNPKITEYWNDYKKKNTLLISAEEAAKSGSRGRNTWPRPTPNSLRSVEASTAFSLRNARN